MGTRTLQRGQTRIVGRWHTHSYGYRSTQTWWEATIEQRWLTPDVRAIHRKVKLKERAAAAVVRRLAMSDADRLALNQRSKKWRDENKERYRKIVERSSAKRAEISC